MKKINLYIFIAIVILPVVRLHAQDYNHNIKYEKVQVEKNGDIVRANININIDSLELRSKDMIIITPEFASIDTSEYSEKFNPVIIAGNRKYKVLERAQRFNYNNCELSNEPELILRHNKNGEKFINMTMETNYKPWMRNAQVLVNESTVGCACKGEGEDDRSLSAMLPPLYEAKYSLIYVTPPAEPVKQRSESYVAHLNFEVNKSILLYDYKENSEILNEVGDIISEIRNDTNLNVTNFRVTGYASPEGPWLNNMNLSENRAKAFVKYLQENYNVDPSYIDIDWRGEDWQGFKELIAASDIQDKDNIMDLLESETDTELIKQELKKLSNGTTYKILLDEYLPPLRRNEYTISYVAKPFDIELAKELIKTKPHYLSQNEMFLVANTYHKESDEFKEVFDIVVKMYPDNHIAQLNTAALEIERGSYDQAIRRLENIDMPEAWNNLGVLHCHKKEYEKAQGYFNRAAESGLEEASINNEELAKLIETL